MFRHGLPAALILLPLSAMAGGTCENIPYSQTNCVRVLACVGDQGVTFDGQSRGWDQGTVAGAMSDGVTCTGKWSSDGPLGTGISNLTCDDGTTVDVIYYAEDGITGTVTGRGIDSKGRAIQVWSGENVLQFLTGADGPALPCVQGDIPVS
jgi:hypothetical protein